MSNTKKPPAIRQSVLVAGQEQSGKTYFCEQLARKYAASGRTAVLYNAGKDDDFSGAEICEPLSLEDMVRQVGKRNKAQIDALNHLPAFRDDRTGKTYPFSVFRKFYAGKMVKIYRHQNERYLFKSFFLHVYDTMLILDDFRGTTRTGLGHELIELVSRKNHAGTKNPERGTAAQGIDTFFVYHNLDTPPAELFDYVNRIVLFRINRIPGDRTKNPEMWERIGEAYEWLKGQERFSYSELAIRGYPEIRTANRPYQK